jgi:hypothetical protein
MVTGPKGLGPEKDYAPQKQDRDCQRVINI